MSIVHKPVLAAKVIDFLNVKPNEKYIDATVGAGGHSLEIIRRGGKVLGLDVDPEVLKIAFQVLGEKAVLKKANYKNIDTLARESGFEKVKGVLFDLGISSFQLSDSERGFSFQRDAPLDMRMDPELKVNAADLVNGLYESELALLFTKLGEEPRAKAIARQVVKSRETSPIKTTKDLAGLILRVKREGGRIHPATQVFQALRIVVNDEHNNLKEALPKATSLLEIGSRLVVISFHSLEDRIVKEFIKEREDLLNLTEKPIRPSVEEVRANPRARSAKLRAAEKR